MDSMALGVDDSLRMVGPMINDVRRIVPEPQVNTISPERTQRFTVKLGSWMYPFAWTGIYVLHFFSATYCMAAALLFQTFPTTTTAFILDVYHVTLPSKYAREIALIYFLFAGLHGWFLINPILRFFFRVGSIMIKRCKRNAPVEPTNHRTFSSIDRFTSGIPQIIEQRTPQILRVPIVCVYTHIFSRTGLFGVEFRYFDSFFLVRETVGTALQSIQAYQMCRLLTRPALNRFFVGNLILNCWATSVLHLVIADKSMQRLWTRLCDVLLDFVASVGIPLILAISYVKIYDPTIKEFPYELYYEDKWFVNALRESPIILFGSWLDALGRLVFSISLIGSLDDIKHLLKYQPPVTVSITKSQRSLSRRDHSTYSRTVTFVHRLLFVYGFIVLGVHLHAELRPCVPEACVLEVRPWLVTKPACSLVEVNCWQNRQLTGNVNDFAHQIDGLDELSLGQITFRHCQHVEIQPSITNFRNLIGIKFYNSTLVAWEDNAALRQQYHNNMRFLFAVRTRFANATFSPGILSHEFPLQLKDMEFSVTNINTIPDDLHTKWPPGIVLCLEYSKLTTFPITLAFANFQSLYLTGSAITQFPAVAFEAIESFVISGNPITELPEDVNVSNVHLWELHFDSTNVSFVPSWLSEWLMLSLANHRVIAGRTPWCQDVVLKANASEKAAEPWLSRIYCPDMDYGVYPLDVEERSNEVW